MELNSNNYKTDVVKSECNTCCFEDKRIENVLIHKCKCHKNDCSCKSIVKTYYNKKGKLAGHFKKIEYINLSDQSVYFHLNEELLHDFSNWMGTRRSNKLLEHRFTTTATNDDEDYYKDKNLLLIGCGSIKRLPVLLSIKKLPLNRLVCLASSKQWAFEYIDEWIMAEHENIEQRDEAVNAIDLYMKENNVKFDAIITYDDLCTMQTSYLSEHYNLPGIPFDISKRIKNKFEFRCLSKKLNINHPHFFQIKSNERNDYINMIKKNQDDELSSIKCIKTEDYCKFPLIIKNTYGVGKGILHNFFILESNFFLNFYNNLIIHQDFVKKCNNLKEFCLSIEASMKVNINMDLLVEEYYDGNFMPNYKINVTFERMKSYKN